MVTHFTMRTHGVNQAFRFVEGIWLHRKSRQIRFFSGKCPCFHDTCATWNEQPFYIKTMVLSSQSGDEVTKTTVRRGLEYDVTVHRLLPPTGTNQSELCWPFWGLVTPPADFALYYKKKSSDNSQQGDHWLLDALEKTHFQKIMLPPFGHPVHDWVRFFPLL